PLLPHPLRSTLFPYTTLFRSAERQFRYPTEYGGQKPPTAQWTVTGAGCALVRKHTTGPTITSATIGKVVDMGLTDPFNMGGAMRSEEHTSELQSRFDLVCRLL